MNQPNSPLPIRHGAVVILLDAQNRLLLKMRDDMPLWCLPGGFADAGEAPLANLQREVSEELNISLPPERFTHIVHYRFMQPLPKAIDIHADLFVARLEDAAVTLGDEGVELRFFSIDELPLNTFANQLEVVHQVWPTLPQPLPPIQLDYDKTFQNLFHRNPADFVGLLHWQNHPRVMQKRAEGRLAYDLPVEGAKNG